MLPNHKRDCIDLATRVSSGLSPGCYILKTRSRPVRVFLLASFSALYVGLCRTTYDYLGTALLAMNGGFATKKKNARTPMG